MNTAMSHWCVTRTLAAMAGSMLFLPFAEGADASGAKPVEPVAGIHQAVPRNTGATRDAIRKRGTRPPPRRYGSQPVVQAQIPRCRNGAALGQACRPLTPDEQQKLLMMMVLWKVSPS